MTTRSVHGVLETFGAYESRGLLEQQYSPYSSYGLEPGETPSPWTSDPASSPATTGWAALAAEVAAKASCEAGGGTWEPTSKTCWKAPAPGQSPELVDVTGNLCQQLGWTWEPNARQCLPPGSQPPPPKPGLTTEQWLGIGFGVLAVGYLLTRKKR